MIRILALGLVAAALVTAGCGGSNSSAASATGEGVRLVTPGEASSLTADDGVRVIDVRTPAEYAEGHLAEATLVDFEASDFAMRIGELARDGRYVVYCRSGNRSGEAVAQMQDLGFTDVANVDGGIVAWEAAGLPVER